MDVFNLADGQLNESQLLDRKKKISTHFLNTFPSLSLFFLHGRIPWNYFCMTELTQTCSCHWEDPTDHSLHKHHARMFCMSDKAGSEGNLHLSWHSKAVTHEIWRSYKLILKKGNRIDSTAMCETVSKQIPTAPEVENSSISLPDTVHARNAAAASIPVTSHEHSKSHYLASNNTRDKLLLASHNHIVFHRKRTFYIEGSSLLIKFSSRWHIFCQFAT